MAIQHEIWAAEIAGNLFPKNSFVSKSIDDSAFVNYKTVHLPQGGAAPTVRRDRSSYPAAAVRRTDSDETYNIHEYTTDPSHVPDIEELETSYAKRQHIVSEHSEVINTSIADWMAYDWAATAAASIVRTTGVDRPATLAGATGNRKSFTKAEILSAKRILDKMDIPEEGRYILLPSEWYNDLLTDKEVLQAEFNNRGKLPDGVVNSLYGVNIMKRSRTLSYTNAATPALRAPDASALATANNAALLWNEKFVRRALGNVKFYDNPNDPQHYGDVFSAMARAGGRKRYTNGRGVVSIVEAAGA